jgi:hypothetical protein
MKLKALILFLISIGIVVFSLDVGMFWDNVLFGSKMGNVLYNNGFTSWRMPVEFDPGHPPFLASVLAFGWTLFGKSLAISHWMMLPFVFGLLWQVHSFVSHFVKDQTSRIAGTILVSIDPTLLSQLVLVNPEIIQLFFFFLALNSLLSNKPWMKALALSLLGIVSFRGMMLCAGLFLIDLGLHLFINRKSWRELFSPVFIAPYLIGAILALSYVVWRLITIGWLQTHPDSQWSELWTFVSVKEFIRNVAVLGFTFIDFGRVLVLGFVLFAIIRLKAWRDSNIQTLLLITVGSIFFVAVVSLISNNTMGHRYYLTAFLTIALIAFILVQKFKQSNWIFVVLVLGLIAGNFIIYPKKMAQGWDASLAHLPYWNLRQETIEYMEQQNIPINETASFFSNYTTLDNVDQNEDQRSFLRFTGNESYVFYSNVYNLSDEEFASLEINYQQIQSFQNRGITILLFQHN